MRPGAVGVFVMPPSFAVLEQRLRGRGKDAEDAIQRRLQTARAEIAAFTEYEYVVVNDELERAWTGCGPSSSRSVRSCGRAAATSNRSSEPSMSLFQ